MPNTIAQNLTRLANAKEAIGAAIAEKGVIVGEEDGLENFSSLILSIPSGSADLNNAALRLIDWEGTVLKEYTAAQVASLTELPVPSSLSTKVDRDLLTFQGWNWALTDIKVWVTAHESECLTVGAIYTTTDGEDHNFWDNPIFGEDMRYAVMQKKGTKNVYTYGYRYYASLKDINIPSGVTSIGGSAFQSCTSLKSISVPNTVTSIGNAAFQYCTSLEAISLTDGLTDIGTNTFSYCTSLKDINIPDTVTGIGENAFQYCTALEQFETPEDVTSIGDSAFQYCLSLKNINIPDGVTAIETRTFFDCASLKTIKIPSSVTSIGNAAFQYCISLNAIVLEDKPDMTNINVFSGIYSGCLIYVPRANLSWFETATNWATYYAQEKIVAIEDNLDFLRALGIDV